MLKIIIDKAIPHSSLFDPQHYQLQPLSAEQITAQACRLADGLVVRSVTPVNEALIANSRIRWVASATIGTDHLDTEFLDANNIPWTAAPGCNALAVVQYVLSVIAWRASMQNCSITDYRIGIIGCGQIGGRLQQALDLLQCKSFVCDPILQQQGKLANHYELLEVAEQADILTLHTPLTRTGEFATYHALDANFFASLATNKLIINAARGDIIVESALIDWLQRGGSACLDVWPNEPNISAELLDLVSLGTGHIAGYSWQGKRNATAMIAQACDEFFGIHRQRDLLAKSTHRDMVVEASENLSAVLLKSYPIDRDAAAFTNAVAPREPLSFMQYRDHYQLRHDYSGQDWRQTQFEALRKAFAKLV
ncbi:MAG: 4-phosphoerythronate dehydrogenase [Gammaproteobacteria bacterium]|nr:4-phosphoerythronate dehydrogenase [Gammaproteobacteria bacterium]